MSENEFKQYFRFQKQHIYDLRKKLGLRNNYTGVNGIKWSGDEGLCILLRRLAYPNRLCDLFPLFGRHETELSLIINVMLQDICSKHMHRLQDVHKPWVEHSDFAEMISAKGCPLEKVWGFLDGTQGRMCRPQVGQESVFNGHKRIHSLKYQSVMTPNGLIAHFFGPIEGRRHDSAMYYLSGLDAHISDIRGQDGSLLALYGDSAYAFRRYLITPFKGAHLTQLQSDFNKKCALCAYV